MHSCEPKDEESIARFPVKNKDGEGFFERRLRRWKLHNSEPGRKKESGRRKNKFRFFRESEESRMEAEKRYETAERRFLLSRLPAQAACAIQNNYR